MYHFRYDNAVSMFKSYMLRSKDISLSVCSKCTFSHNANSSYGTVKRNYPLLNHVTVNHIVICSTVCCDSGRAKSRDSTRANIGQLRTVGLGGDVQVTQPVREIGQNNTFFAHFPRDGSVIL